MKYDLKTDEWRLVINTAFNSHNVKHALLIPGCLLGMVALFIGLTSVMCLIFLLNGTVLPSYTWTGVLLLIGMVPIGLALGAVCGVALMGYYWNLVATFQQHGLNTDVPAWSHGQWCNHLHRGWHMTGYFLILLLFGNLFFNLLAHLTGYTAYAEMIDTPLIGDFNLIQFHDTDNDYLHLFQSAGWTSLIMLTSLTLALPFLLGPLFYNANRKNFCALFTNLRASFRWTIERYWRVFGVGLFIHTFFILLFGVSILVLSLTGIGLVCIPFLVILGLTVATGLYTWAFMPLKNNLPVSMNVIDKPDK